MTKLFNIANSNAITESANILKEGGLVAFPTETIYGLGADALNEVAVKNIFIAKGRPQDNPLIVHVSSQDDVEKLAHLNENAKKLIDVFFPGPLTIVLKKKDIVPDVTTAGLDSVAVRMPDHKLTLDLISKSNSFIAAPSANTSGKPSPLNAKSVEEDLYGKIDAIIDGGNTDIGIESTVLDLTSEVPLLLRPGLVTVEDIEGVVGKIDVHKSITQSKVDLDSPKSPGMKYTHYSPNANVVLVENSNVVDIAKQKGESVCLITFQKDIDVKVEKLIQVKDNRDLSSKLFDVFRECDREGIKYIIVEAPKNDGFGLAVLNRLKKASNEIC